MTTALNKEHPIPRLTSSPLFEIDETAFEWGFRTIEEFVALDPYSKARMVALSIAKNWRELVMSNGDKLDIDG